MAKIGILTYHRAENFGAVMQAYALSAYLMSNGHQVEIIDYRCKAVEVHYQIFNPSILLSRKNVFASLCEYINRFSTIKTRYIRKKKFQEFRDKYLMLSNSISSIKSPLNYDVVIVGSDQVWNFHLNKGAERIYLLDIPCKAQTKKMSYAASSDQNGLNRINCGYLAQCLATFNQISVREHFIKAQLSAYIQKPISVCLDPTFLLEKDDYLQLAERIDITNYILVYHMAPVHDYLPKIKDIAENSGLKVIEIYGGFYQGNDDNVITDWGPCDVLGLISKASMVFTTSFHGLALSLIMKKNVWVIDKGNNFRQKNLLEIVGIPDRLWTDINSFNYSEIDYSEVQAQLNAEKESSKNYLRF